MLPNWMHNSKQTQGPVHYAQVNQCVTASNPCFAALKLSESTVKEDCWIIHNYISSIVYANTMSNLNNGRDYGSLSEKHIAVTQNQTNCRHRLRLRLEESYSHDTDVIISDLMKYTQLSELQQRGYLSKSFSENIIEMSVCLMKIYSHTNFRRWHSADTNL